MEDHANCSKMVQKQEIYKIHDSKNRPEMNSSKQRSSPMTAVRRRFLATMERRKSVQLNSGGLALVQNDRISGQNDERSVKNNEALVQKDETVIKNEEIVKNACSKKIRELVDRAPIFMSGRRNCLCFGKNLGCRCFSCTKLNSAKNKETIIKVHRSTPTRAHCEIHDSVWPSLPCTAGLSSEDWKNPTGHSDQLGQDSEQQSDSDWYEDLHSVDEVSFDNASTIYQNKTTHSSMIYDDETGSSSVNEKTIYEHDETYANSAYHPFTMFHEWSMYFPSFTAKSTTSSVCTRPNEIYKSESRFVITKRFKSYTVPRRISVVLPEGHVQKLTAFYEEKSYE